MLDVLALGTCGNYTVVQTTLTGSSAMRQSRPMKITFVPIWNGFGTDTWLSVQGFEIRQLCPEVGAPVRWKYYFGTLRWLKQDCYPLVAWVDPAFANELSLVSRVLGLWVCLLLVLSASTWFGPGCQWSILSVATWQFRYSKMQAFPCKIFQLIIRFIRYHYYIYHYSFEVNLMDVRVFSTQKKTVKWVAARLVYAHQAFLPQQSEQILVCQF